MEKYDVIVIGGGPGGYVAAIKASHLNLKVALVEKHKLGGICLNYGCIPTKTLLRSARLFKDILKASEFGIDIGNSSDVSINWENLMKRKDIVVEKLVGGVKQLIKHNNIDLINGFATVINKNLIKVNDIEYNCENLILATGSSPFMPDILGLKESLLKKIAIDSTGALRLGKLPKTLTVLGGSVIAIEFATLYQSLGCQVTVLQRSSKILKMLDKDIQKVIDKELRILGINIITNVKLLSIEGHNVLYEYKGKKENLYGENILVSLGRKPNLEGLENLDLKTNKKGVIVDKHMETNIKNVYAIGDMNGKYMLAHVASAEGIVACETISGDKTTINYNKIPSCIYSFPEIGTVGLTEEEALELGHEIDTSTFPLSANAKAIAEGDSIGFIKIIADKTYGEVIGVHIIAAHATDMIAEAVATMELEGTVHDLVKTVHPHPTLSEIVMEAAHGVVDKPIHLIKK